MRAYTHDNHHIVIGVSNVDNQIKQLESGERHNELQFSSLARALSNDVESIYYVDTETDTYMEFSSEGAYKQLGLELSGKDFFGECRTNIEKVVYPDDQERVAQALDKDHAGSHPARAVFTSRMDYRLVIDGEPLYYNMKAYWANRRQQPHHHRRGQRGRRDNRRAEARGQRRPVTYATIVHALATDYFCIYYVNPDTGRFIEYSAHEMYHGLGIERSGDDFFYDSRQNILRVIHPDDVDMFLEAFTRENVIAALDHHGHSPSPTA